MATYTQSTFAFVGVPRKYSGGVIDDRTNPFLLRAHTKRRLPAGDYELLLRAKGATRLFVDGQLVTQAKFLSHNADGHEEVPELSTSTHDGLYTPAPGNQEHSATVKLAKGEHVFCLEVIVGGKGLRAEIGEVCVCLAEDGEPYVVLSASNAEDQHRVGRCRWPHAGCRHHAQAGRQDSAGMAV